MANHGIQVSCRIRDVANGSDAGAVGAGSRSCISVGHDVQTIVVHPNGSVASPVDNNNTSTPSYSCFDYVFSGRATQEAVFDSVGKPFVDDVLAGYNCTVFAYGQTGSGKTFTTIGDGNEDARGLIPRAMERIFQEIERVYRRTSGDDAEWDVELTASFVEVYQESLRDLLLPHNSRNVKIRGDRENGVFVEGASERHGGSRERRCPASHRHCVFALTFTKKNAVARERVRGKLLLVDLAGSEKASKTAASGKRLDEAKHINRSLSTLGNVINALADGGKSKYIPYRDSKLTRLLQSSLGGNAKTHLLLTCSASELHVHETLSTLRFGARAKRILNAPHVNNEKSTSASEYKELLSTLKAKIESLCSYIRRLESSRCASWCLQQSSVVANTDLLREDGCQSSIDTITEAAEWCSLSGKPQTCEDPSHCDNPACISSATEESRSSLNGSDAVPADPSTSPAISRLSSSSSSETAESHRHELLDELMQEELNSLRKAVTEMQCDRHEAEHARRLASAMLDVSHVEGRAPSRTQAGKIHQQEAELTDAHATISSLERQLAQLQSERSQVTSTCEHLRLEVKQLRQQQQTQWGEAQSAETEILRRRLAALEKQAQVELLASLKLQEGAFVVPLQLRAKLLAKNLELRQLEEESASLRLKLVSAASQSTPNLPSTTSSKQIALRPFTAIGELGSSGAGGSGGMGNIQNWWAGSPDQIPPCQSHEELAEQHGSPPAWRPGFGQQQHPQQSERRRVNSTKLVLGGASACGLGSPEMLIPPECLLNRGEERRCRSQGAHSRPFRARFVGLLNSLEEETSSLKDLISESKRDTSPQMRPAAAGADKQRYRLPCLETPNPG